MDDTTEFEGITTKQMRAIEFIGWLNDHLHSEGVGCDLDKHYRNAINLCNDKHPDTFYYKLTLLKIAYRKYMTSLTIDNVTNNYNKLWQLIEETTA